MRESRHKIDELEEKAALLDPGRVQAQEAELRDLRCKVELLTRKRRMSCGHCVTQLMLYTGEKLSSPIF